MLIFGVDVPLIELVFTLAVITFLLLVESIILVTLLVKQHKRSQKMTELIEDLSKTILEIKKSEIEELDKLRSTMR